MTGFSKLKHVACAGAAHWQRSLGALLAAAMLVGLSACGQDKPDAVAAADAAADTVMDASGEQGDDGAVATVGQTATAAGEGFAALHAPRILATGATISGANGLAFGPDGLLYVASVIGSEIVVMDPRDGAVRRRLSTLEGVNGPDDLAFGPDGSMYWTSILTGEVVGFDAAGRRVVAGAPGVGVNPITFSTDGRLFVAQCFFGDGLFELDPAGNTPPRLIADDLGPGCGLNGMDWGTDGRLYGPRWFTGEVVSVDVATGERRVEASGFAVPAAVKFDGRGNLHVLDTGTGQVMRVDDSGPVEVARLQPGMDNLAFDLRNRLYLSSFTDGFVVRVDADGSVTELAPGGMAHPGGVAILPGVDGAPDQVIVADLHSIRGFDPDTGAETLVERNVLGVGALGSAIAVAADAGNLILTAFTDSNVRVWDPRERKVIERHEGIEQPVSALRYHGELVVAEHGKGRVIGLSPTGDVRVIADDLKAPAGLASDGNILYVTDRERGRVFAIAEAGAPIRRVVARDLAAPEGLALHGSDLIVVEGETGRVLRVATDGVVTLLALVAPGTPPASPAQPPAMVFNGVAVRGDTLYVTGETNRVLYRIDLAGENLPAVDPDNPEQNEESEVSP